jgi:ribosome-associated protein
VRHPGGGSAGRTESRTITEQLDTKPARFVLDLVTRSLDADKAVDPVVIDLSGKTPLADYMVVATGTSARHLGAMADKLIERLKESGKDGVAAEGLGDTGWVLIDAGDVIVHLFRAETRDFYQIEKLWSVAPPTSREELRAAAGQ